MYARERMDSVKLGIIIVRFFKIENDGKDIVSTNYFDSEYAHKGYYFLSTNAGCVRLLIPDSQIAALFEFKTAKYAILSRGPWPAQARNDAIELLFEDFSDSPYVIHMVLDQCDILPDGKGAWVLALWTRRGKQFQCPLKYRRVDRLPYLKPWKGT